ncbi:hypothetical protein NDU88_006708 [Pleurodeles waltl]|uniref:Uncharacterized protein n=1 Tax=Pleurodeles waltl TaxID=8319 RepID=A0AAV7LRG6_PLEWA|nr:hypothetical protein NDU88_006708 [Pleurodeles waltl]
MGWPIASSMWTARLPDLIAEIEGGRARPWSRRITLHKLGRLQRGGDMPWTLSNPVCLKCALREDAWRASRHPASSRCQAMRAPRTGYLDEGSSVRRRGLRFIVFVYGVVLHYLRLSYAVSNYLPSAKTA